MIPVPRPGRRQVQAERRRRPAAKRRS
jgi:hypothetical protein